MANKQISCPAPILYSYVYAKSIPERTLVFEKNTSVFVLVARRKGLGMHTGESFFIIKSALVGLGVPRRFLKQLPPEFNKKYLKWLYSHYFKWLISKTVKKIAN